MHKDLDDQTGILSGENIEIFEFNGKLTVINKVMGSSVGSLKHLKPCLAMRDDESLVDALNKPETV